MTRGGQKPLSTSSFLQFPRTSFPLTCVSLPCSTGLSAACMHAYTSLCVVNQVSLTCALHYPVPPHDRRLHGPVVCPRRRSLACARLQLVEHALSLRLSRQHALLKCRVHVDVKPDRHGRPVRICCHPPKPKPPCPSRPALPAVARHLTHRASNLSSWLVCCNLPVFCALTPSSLFLVTKQDIRGDTRRRRRRGRYLPVPCEEGAGGGRKI